MSSSSLARPMTRVQAVDARLRAVVIVLAGSQLIGDGLRPGAVQRRHEQP